MKLDGTKQSATATASQIANALQRSKRSVLYALDGCEPSAAVRVNGRSVNAWQGPDLPQRLRDQLHTEAARRGLLSADALLIESSKEWKPHLPLSEIAQHSLDKGANLQRAIMPTLNQLDDCTLSEGERLARFMEDFQRTFGYSISERHARNLLKRTLTRDRGAKNWARLELFLDDRVARKPEAVAFSDARDGEFRELHESIAGFKNPARPSSREEQYLWLRSLEVLVEMIEAGKPEKRAKRALLNFLKRHAPWLAKSGMALQRAFNRKLHTRATAIANGENPALALADGREQRRGESIADPLPQEDLDKIIWRAGRHCGGRMAQAVRELIERGELSTQVTEVLENRFSKSHLPERLREAIGPEIQMLAPYHQGPRAVNKQKAWHTRDYTGIKSMDCVQADDFTMPVYFFVPDGKGWFTLTRGQVLLVIDFRSLRILGYSLQPERQYTSVNIRTVFTRVFAQWGLPRIAYLESGIWKRSKLITGGPRIAKFWREEDMPLSWPDCEIGLRQYGIEFIHARQARSKIVERVGGLLQDLMEGERGYTGREERKDKPEATARAEAAVNRKSIHPHEAFYSFEEWDHRLSEIVANYNAAVQEGQILDGLSPDQAFESNWPQDDPPTRFDAACRYLLAYHRVIAEVKENGFSFKLRGRNHVFRDEQTSKWRGQKLIGWFNPETPEVITLTDQDMRNAFTVERANPVHALWPDREQFSAETRKVEAHSSYPLARYRVLKAKFEPRFRQLVVKTPETISLGIAINEQQTAIRTRRDETDKLEARVSRLADQARVPKTILEPCPDTARNLERMIEAERRALANESEIGI